MGVIQSINETSNKAFDYGEEYVKASQDYYKLKAFKQLAKAFSFLSKLAIIGGLFFLGLIFLGAAATLWLGNILDSLMLSFLIIATLFFVCTLIFYYFLRKLIDTKIIKKMSKEFFD